MKTPMEKIRLNTFGQRLAGVNTALEKNARNGDVNALTNLAIISALDAIHIELVDINRIIENLVKK